MANIYPRQQPSVRPFSVPKQETTMKKLKVVAPIFDRSELMPKISPIAKIGALSPYSITF